MATATGLATRADVPASDTLDRGAPPPVDPPPARRSRRLPPWRNPWRRPWILEGFTWLYLIWSIVPIAIAVLFSFNNGKSQSVWQGFSTRWYWGDPINSVFHNPELRDSVVQTVRLSVLTTVICVPLGVMFAIGINRWRTRTSTTFNFVMVFSYVIPELIFGVALFFLFTQLFTAIHLGTAAEVLGLVTWNVSWPAIIVLARLVSIGSSYDEAAADLGASRLSAIRRVLLPLLMPAVFASAVLVFASVVDDFVVVDLLSSTANTQPMSVFIYSTTHGGNGGPALNALATIMLVLSFVVATIGLIAYRWMTRGERGASRQEAMTSIAGM
jgi:spermidine/putrescine transport system permease protein